MIDIELTEELPNLDEFDLIQDKYPLLFLGFFIKNEYDNKRLHLNSKFKPIKFLHLTDVNCVTPFYGVILKPNKNILKIFDIIEKQKKNKNFGLTTYENILNQFNMSCKETHAHFSKNIHPIDFENLKSVCEDSFNTDKKIFQHLLSLNEKVFDFQKFASLKLFILTS